MAYRGTSNKRKPLNIHYHTTHTPHYGKEIGVLYLLIISSLTHMLLRRSQVSDDFVTKLERLLDF